jgi:glycosyltransferase involved in cell wall biosynthesis
MSVNRKVVHLSSAHPRDDIRIFHKMSSSLSKRYNVHLVVADGLGKNFVNGVTILDVGGGCGGRLSRMTKTVSKVYNKALELEGDIYHLHDPELIPIGLKLKRRGYKVIFDAHEDLPKQILSKPYLNPFTRKILSVFFDLYERYAFKKFDGLIGATPVITQKLSKINSNSFNINNYPILDELNLHVPWLDKAKEICYLGGITHIRGIKEVVKSLGYTDGVRLNLAGKFSESDVEKEVKSWPEWQQVNELGLISRESVAEVLGSSKVGIVTFHACPNHVDAQPNKMFEYMSAGLPIIASNFPMWKDVVEGNDCGICVDPMDPEEIGKAIKHLIDNPAEAERKSRNGYNAVVRKYNWPAEEVKLFKLYESVLFI